MRIYKLSIISLVFTLGIVLFSCENDIQMVNKITDPTVIPEVAGSEVEILYSDSAKIKAKITAPELNRFRKQDNKPYLEFPKGIHVYFYDDNFKLKAEVYSKYAIYQEAAKLWEARNDVVVVNVKGDRLNTEQLFWDENKQIIYTNKFAKVTKLNGEVAIGQRGMTAAQDFSHWRMIGNSGTMFFRDEQE